TRVNNIVEPARDGENPRFQHTAIRGLKPPWLGEGFMAWGIAITLRDSGPTQVDSSVLHPNLRAGQSYAVIDTADSGLRGAIGGGDVDNQFHRGVQLQRIGSCSA